MKKPVLLLNICLVFVIFSLLLGSCKVKTADAPAPIKEIAKTENRPLSTINIPISLSIKDLEAAINKQFNGVLYNDDSYENNDNDNLIVSVKKIDAFQLSASADKIKIIAPLEVYVKGRLKKDFFSLFDQDFGIDKSKDATFRLNVVVNTKISVNQDWDIITKSEAGFQWREQPYLELGPIKIPIGSIIETAVNNQIADINKKLDAEITKNIKIKPMATQLWNQLQAPIVVSERYQTYLKIIPEFISLSNVNSDGKKLDVNLGFRSDIAFVSGSKPEPVELKPLPKLQQQTRIDSTFNLYFNASMNFNYATQLAKEQFVGKTLKFDNDKQEVTINDLSFFNNGNKLGMMLNLTGFYRTGFFKKKFKGTVYALGTPVYNDSTQILSIKDFDFDVKSKDALIGTAEWLLKGSFKKTIQEKLKYSMKDEIDKAIKSADDALKNAKIPNMKLNGKVEKIKPYGISLSDQGIQVVIQSTGNLKVMINKF
jgi:Domain of unknown function (DUF4403)